MATPKKEEGILKIKNTKPFTSDEQLDIYQTQAKSLKKMFKEAANNPADKNGSLYRGMESLALLTEVTIETQKRQEKEIKKLKKKLNAFNKK